MSIVRIIPRLDIKGPNLVKGIHLEGLRVLGKPELFARHYYETGADELIYMDIVASLYGRNSLHEIIQRTAQEIFIPLTVGGGLRTIDDIRAVLRAGADKVSLNTAVINRPELIREAARKFGSSTIVISIESKKRADGTYEAYTDNGRVRTGVDVVRWAQQVAELGAGEILLTSIDREGTGLGFDIELTHTISQAVTIPVIACGGCGKVDDVCQVVLEGHADAVSLASLLHYSCTSQWTVSDRGGEEEGNREFLLQRRQFSKFKGTTIGEIKRALTQNKIFCRTEFSCPGVTP